MPLFCFCFFSWRNEWILEFSSPFSPNLQGNKIFVLGCTYHEVQPILFSDLGINI
ncbi:hypothetical protein POREN0001_0672 [Porphyromonas endodontalis ATCC 35406]|uniref:Uncharacterized protein n=1 Tax=Porphyromonas endodontalis (strain ATCC 35406 / DSM 24491 / JCM 8526 / CCUG 16442 / BCRC 14492 / NCTC 13058 / HG 370) TaxID=553175 RepID=C3JCY5_POREA|nr:hypothetical protein POREN0001_0672 [Porphyromonas endodontalis ATCC 35406]